MIRAMLKTSRAKFGGCLCALALLLLAGCVPLSTKRIQRADHIVALSADSRIDCQRADRCAEPSPFLAQADRAIADSTREKPRNTVTLLNVGQNALVARSEERRVGKECRSRWSPGQKKKNRK